MTIFRLVGGTDVKPTGRIANPAAGTARIKTCKKSVTIVVDNFIETRRAADETLSTTAENGRLRAQRCDIWRAAEAATQYWRQRLKFESAISYAQRMEIPEGSYHPVVESKDRYAMVGLWRKALVKQLLTPAPDTASVKWKQTVLAGR